MSKSTIVSWIMNYAHEIGKIPGVKPLFSKLYWSCYRKFYLMPMNKNLHKNALPVLADFDRVMSENNVCYSACAGTLLGAVREHGFIKHDLDVDTLIFNKDYSPKIQMILEAAGFTLVKRYLVENGEKGREETYEKNGVGIDIFYAYEDEESTYLCDFCTTLPDVVTPEGSMKKYGRVACRRLNLPFKYEFIRVPFESITISIMANYEEWLSTRYGSDYMIPNPKFHDKPEHKFIRIWDEVTAIYWWKK